MAVEPLHLGRLARSHESARLHSGYESNPSSDEGTARAVAGQRVALVLIELTQGLN